MTSYDIGPFQNIVGVGWNTGTEPPDTAPLAIALTFDMIFYGNTVFAVTCTPPYPNDPLYDPSNTAMGAYTEFVRLLPNAPFNPRKGVSAAYDENFGLLNILDVAISGQPPTPGDVYAPGPYQWPVQNRFLHLYPTMGYEDGSAHRVITTDSTSPPLTDTTFMYSFTKNLEADFRLMGDSWGGPDSDVYCHPDGYEAVNVIGPDGVEEIFASSTLNFSSVQVTHLPTGQQYAAHALKTVSGTMFGNRVMVLCTRVVV